jgi:hypothetical protein
MERPPKHDNIGGCKNWMAYADYLEARIKKLEEAAKSFHPNCPNPYCRLCNALKALEE